jgi:hypothetical protein
LEAWEIWLRWEDAFRLGKTTQDTHPALPDDRSRYTDIANVLPARLSALPGPAIRATAVFRPGGGARRDLEVRWSPLASSNESN